MPHPDIYIVRSFFNRLLTVEHRLLIFPFAAKSDAKVKQHLHRIRLALERIAVTLSRRCRLLHFEEQAAEVVVCLEIAGPDANGITETLFRLFKLALLMIDEAQIIICHRIGRVAAEALFISHGGILQLPLPLENRGQQKTQPCVLRRKGQPRLADGFSLVQPALGCQGVRLPVMCIHVAGLMGRHD